MILNPRFLYTAAQVRELDRVAIEEHQIDGYALMCQAGRSAYRVARTRWPAARRITVVCGSGNNGGDGYVVAKLALQDGLEAGVLAVSPARSEAALKACRDYQALGGQVMPFQMAKLAQGELLVDAMLGTGLNQVLSRNYTDVVDAINNSDRPVLALDVPTGLNSDTGARMGAAIKAQATITFIGAKVGLFTGNGPSCTGTVLFDDLDIPDSVYAGIHPEVQIIMPQLDAISLPRRDPVMHKGLAGRVLVAGGGKGMPGAARMAAEAAYRCGAGLVQVATHKDHVHQVMSHLPEIMAFDAQESTDLDLAISQADVIAVGPGLGQSKWSRTLLNRVLEAEPPLVVDADALNLVAALKARRANWVLTPHPGEAARLLGSDTLAVQNDRLGAVRDLQQRYGGVVVLKGAGSLVNEGRLWLCHRGNPGMASGGMGDVLTGIISSQIAQGQTLSAAARYGVWVHAAAADRAADAAGQIGLLATDILPFARQIIND